MPTKFPLTIGKVTIRRVQRIDTWLEATEAAGQRRAIGGVYLLRGEAEEQALARLTAKLDGLLPTGPDVAEPA